MDFRSEFEFHTGSQVLHPRYFFLNCYLGDEFVHVESPVVSGSDVNLILMGDIYLFSWEA